MATHGDRTSFTFDAPIPTANLIVMVSPVNNHGAALATADALPLLGVIMEPTDLNNAAAVQFTGIAPVTAGAPITQGQQICSNTLGQAIPVTPSASGTSERGVLGTALESASVGNLLDVMIQKSYAANAT